MYDVIIIGAGPSGLNSARRLAKKGLDILVLEKKEKIGSHVVCTGIVSVDAFTEFGLSPSSILLPIDKIKWVSPRGNELLYEHPRPFAYVVDREKFDKNLYEEAKLLGVDVILHSEVVDIVYRDGYLEVEVMREKKYKQKFRAQIVIIASGIDYRLNKKLGLGIPRNFLYAVQAELNLEEFVFPHVFVGREIAKGAFAWAVPIKNSMVRIGLMTEENSKECFKRLLKKYFPFEVNNLDKANIQYKTIAQGIVSPTYGRRVLSVGEAAAQVKTTTGGGIYFGLLCSEIASQVVNRLFEIGNFEKSELSEYERLWKKAIQKEIIVGYYTRKICGKFSDNQIDKMFKIAQSDGVIPLIKERGDFDWHSGLLLTLMKRIPVFQMIKTCFERE